MCIRDSTFYRKFSATILVLGLLTASYLPVFGGFGPGAKTNQSNLYRPGVVVVKFKSDVALPDQTTATGLASLDRVLNKYGVSQMERIDAFLPRAKRNLLGASFQRIYYVYYESAVSPARVAAELSGDVNLVYAEPLYLHHLDVTPNDPQFTSQTFYNIVKAQQAWDNTKGSQGNVVIAIVDGGTDITHEDLAGNLWVNPGEIAGNGIDDDNNGFIDDINGWNFANNTPNPKGLVNTPQSADHGTHTAGLADAVTNNLIGVAGMAWNTQLMAIDAGDPNNDLGIAFGFKGILYAAMNGADVISLSWGRGGPPSLFEQDVINQAVSLGAAIVAAAGNENTSALHFPSSYTNVLSVAATDNTDRKASFSNFGSTVDVTAPGVTILSTLNNSRYGVLSGTSMSTPIAAGIVGLVRTQHPEYNGIQAIEQVRVSADNIDSINPFYAGQLGKGRVNALRALTISAPSLRIKNVSFTETNGNGIIDPGETVQMTLTLINYLAPAANVNLTVTESDPDVTLQSSGATIPSIGTLQEATNPTPIIFDVAANTPSGHTIVFTLNISAGTFTDRQFFSLTVQPQFGNLTINNISTTVTSVGRIGFGDTNNQVQGLGFKFKGGPNLMFEGALIAGTGPTKISDAARSNLDVNGTLLFHKDFRPVKGGDLRISTPGNLTDQESFAIFNDSSATSPLGIRITQETFAQSSPPNDDFILFRYSIENTTAADLSNFHFGIFFDWDIDANTFATNIARYDTTHRMGYAFDNGTGGPASYVGISLLTPGTVNYRAIFNDDKAPANPSWGIYDGYTNQEKWESISGALQFSSSGPADISHVLAVGPMTIPAAQFEEVGFALIGGDNLADLQANAEAAQALWNSLFVTDIGDPPSNPVPQTFKLAQNFPNPFNPTTKIQYQIPSGAGTPEVTLEIYDIVGRKVRTLVQKRQSAGVYTVRWDGRNQRGVPVASGIYVYRIRAGQFVQARKMVLLK